MSGNASITTTGLSRQQTALLLWLYRKQTANRLFFRSSGYESNHRDFGSACDFTDFHVADRKEQPLTRSESASFSRTARRLELRGLISRENPNVGMDRGRMTHICMTPAGAELAVSLAQRHWGQDWQRRLTVESMDLDVNRLYPRAECGGAA
jgi:hypothetical protein